MAQVIALLRWALIIIFIAFGWIVLSYIAKVLERLVAQGMSRAVGAGLLLISFLGLIIGGIAAAIPAVADQVAQFGHDLPRLVTNLDLWLHDHFGVELPDDWKQYLNK